MKKLWIVAALVAISLPPVAAQNVKTGIEVLKSEEFKTLHGKRVGLITNPTGVDGELRSTVDILHDAPGVELVALFAPEHGVRGSDWAGESVAGGIDPVTRLPVWSLHGKTRKPTADMLDGLDALVYDIQDIGCRSYTYISTMGLAMEAAAEKGIEFVVLDRPNPLGGERIEGCLVEPDCVSFVSQFPIPYLYGLTCGELAMMLNGEGMLSGGVRCDLRVVRMKGWRRSMDYTATGLQWVPASPHIPHPHSATFYPASGIAGELGWLSVGVGYTLPFQLFAAPWIEPQEFTRRMNALGLGGVLFRPVWFKPFYAFGKGELLGGAQLHIVDGRGVSLTEIQFLAMETLAAMYPGKAPFGEATRGRFRMFDQVCGSRRIRELFAARNVWADAAEYWRKDAEGFRRLSKQYYLYK